MRQLSLWVKCRRWFDSKNIRNWPLDRWFPRDQRCFRVDGSRMVWWQARPNALAVLWGGRLAALSKQFDVPQM